MLGIGADISMDVEDKDFDASLSKGFALKAGVGASYTAGEGHILYTSTQTQKLEIDNSEENKQKIMDRYHEHH